LAGVDRQFRINGGKKAHDLTLVHFFPIRMLLAPLLAAETAIFRLAAER
jgi:hypothetical protein